MKETDTMEGMAPKRRRMMEMVLALGGLREETTIHPGKINEEIDGLRDGLSPLVEEILKLPDEYYTSFASIAEKTQLVDKIDDKSILQSSIENIEQAISISPLKGADTLLIELKAALKKVEEEAETSEEVEKLVEELLGVRSSAQSNPKSAQALLEKLDIKIRYGAPPCHVACPAGVRVQRFVNLTRDEQFDEALALMRETYPFPGTLGRVCNAPCEDDCTRGRIDQSVSIRNLHRFLADNERKQGTKPPTKITLDESDKIAIFGAGPAGIGCAYDLVRKGYPVTIFEAQSKTGGLLRYGIPSYRLPRDILDEEIAYVESLGVEIKTGKRIDSPSALLEQGFKAVFVATGASSSRAMKIEGEDAKGVHHALDFLQKLNKYEKVSLGKRVAVIGGGNAAVDSARVAKRLGCEVTMIYRRSKKEMPAHHLEVEATEDEGIEIMILSTPIRVLESDGKLNGLECIKMKLGEPDSSGRRRPEPIEGSEFVVDVDDVIIAIGQLIAPEDYFSDLEYSAWGWIDTDPITLQTSVEGVFAGGDAVSGPATVVKAVGAGKKAAESICHYLSGAELSSAMEDSGRIVANVDAERVQAEEIRRAQMPELEVESRKGNFDEVELGFDTDTSICEAARCINCSLSNMTVNVYGEEIDPEAHEELTSAYLNNEIERGAILTLIRHLGAMTAEGLAAKTGLPQDRTLQHLLRMKRSELLVILGESHGYLLYDVPRTPSEAEITLETVSSLALQLAQANSDLDTLLKDLKAQDIGTLAGALEVFSRARDRLEQITISGSIINEDSLVSIEEKIRSAVIMTTRTRARLPSTRPKVTIEDLVDIDVPTVLEEYESQMGYTPLLGFGTINWDDSKCLGCKSCEIICPEDAIKLKPIIETPRMFEMDEAALEQLPVNKSLFYQTVRNLAVEKASQNIHLESEAPGFGTVETDLYLCIGCRSCVRRCPGPDKGALELELKWTLPEVIRQITTQSQ